MSYAGIYGTNKNNNYIQKNETNYVQLDINTFYIWKKDTLSRHLPNTLLKDSPQMTSQSRHVQLTSLPQSKFLTPPLTL